jgi:hypothetical protein
MFVLRREALQNIYSTEVKSQFILVQFLHILASHVNPTVSEDFTKEMKREKKKTISPSIPGGNDQIKRRLAEGI